jgi:hypothetical protein
MFMHNIKKRETFKHLQSKSGKTLFSSFNCGQTNCNRLEKIQIEAARIVTGLSIYASFDSIYKETGWETLSTRREVKKNAIFFFYKIVNKDSKIGRMKTKYIFSR